MTNENKKMRRSHRYGPPPANRKKGNPGIHEKICALLNFPEYVLQYIFVLVEKNGYRLVVLHRGDVKTNEFYSSLKAAKIAFARLYNRKSWNPNAIPRWTELYEPNHKWLTDKLEFLRNSSSNRHNNKRRKHRITRHKEVSIYGGKN